MMFKLDFKKAEEPHWLISGWIISWVIKKVRESQKKTSTSALLIMPKSLTLWITTNCGKIFQELGIPDHLTCLLRNPNAGQEATVRTRHGITDWFQIGKGVCQG